MRQAQAKENTSRIGIPGGRHSPAQTGKKNETLGGGRRLLGFGIQQFIWTDSAPRSLSTFMRGKCIEEPAIAPTRDKTRILNQPGFRVGMAMGFQESSII